MTTSSALWCSRKTGSAAAVSRGARNAGRTSSTRPTWASASASAAAEGGDRFDSAAPGTPTAEAGWPRPSRAANATAPAPSSAAPHERRHPCRATSTPTCHGAHHTASTFAQPGPAHQASAATSATGSATPHQPSRVISGVAASSSTYTPRNHSGVTTAYPVFHTVPCGRPRTDNPNRTTAHTASSPATGGNSRRTLDHHGVVERAAPNPPVKKNRPSTWSTQLAGASSGIHRSGLSTTSPSSVSTSAVTSQWPSTTPTTASARVASTRGSRPVTATRPPRAGRGPAATATRA
ncbi:hypothetical protein NUG22_29960 [Saccharothrix longispora]|nr:hypothetical protein [Saccharothrix longispora]MDU0293456.1 hypothetical protein [Saccharothrix longispora]